MKFFTLVTLAAGAMASVNIADDIAHGLRMGLLPRQVATNNLQAFTSGLGGLSADAITQSNDATRQFEVSGDTFNDFQSAANRACDNQHNACADMANSQKGKPFAVSDCDQQTTQCKSALQSASKQSFLTLASSDDDFDIFCPS